MQSLLRRRFQPFSKWLLENPRSEMKHQRLESKNAGFFGLGFGVRAGRRMCVERQFFVIMAQPPEAVSESDSWIAGGVRELGEAPWYGARLGPLYPYLFSAGLKGRKQSWSIALCLE
jgi:hypothetical protein